MKNINSVGLWEISALGFDQMFLQKTKATWKHYKSLKDIGGFVHGILSMKLLHISFQSTQQPQKTKCIFQSLVYQFPCHIP